MCHEASKRMCCRLVHQTSADHLVMDWILVRQTICESLGHGLACTDMTGRMQCGYAVATAKAPAQSAT
jgi:hypothetical protein